MKICEVIEKMDEFHQPYTPGKSTRDKVLYGDPDQQCTGIAVTATANYDVLQKAVEQGVNLIISHEGITYNYEKSFNVDEVRNEVLQAKLKYIRDNGLCIWRDHDHMHGNGGPMMKERLRNDMIFYGTMKELGWEKYCESDPKKPLWFRIPEKTAEELAQELIEKWNLRGLRIVGNRNAVIRISHRLVIFPLPPVSFSLCFGFRLSFSPDCFLPSSFSREIHFPPAASAGEEFLQPGSGKPYILQTGKMRDCSGLSVFLSGEKTYSYCRDRYRLLKTDP